MYACSAPLMQNVFDMTHMLDCKNTMNANEQRGGGVLQPVFQKVQPRLAIICQDNMSKELSFMNIHMSILLIQCVGNTIKGKSSFGSGLT